MNSSALWTIAMAVFGLFLGAYVPTLIVVVVRYIRHWKRQEARSVLRLIGGILLRIYAPFLIVAPFVFLPDFEKRIDENVVAAGVGELVGLFGSIALFVSAYRLGRKERLQTSSK